jgi:hypothetical protein
MRDPGEEIARDRQRDEQPPVGGDERDHRKRDDQAGADIVERASARLGMLTQIERPEFGEGGVDAGHGNQLAFLLQVGQVERAKCTERNDFGRRAWSGDVGQARTDSKDPK